MSSRKRRQPKRPTEPQYVQGKPVPKALLADFRGAFGEMDAANKLVKLLQDQLKVAMEAAADTRAVYLHFEKKIQKKCNLKEGDRVNPDGSVGVLIQTPTGATE